MFKPEPDLNGAELGKLACVLLRPDSNLTGNDGTASQQRLWTDGCEYSVRPSRDGPRTR